MLSDDGRYVHFDRDDNWWIPSGRVLLSPNEDDDAAQELAFAQQHFFMPLRFRDPFGETATVEYDTHDLLKVRTTDPLENSVTAQNDYRRLAPDLVTDPNGNRSAVAFDVLGMVAGTAVMGKESETVGDSLGGFQAQLTQAQIDAFFADPRGLNSTELLGNATSRIIYDETRFQRLEQPPFGATIVRETHVSDLGDGEETAVQVSLAYWDGVGRTIQNKVQAEPGPVEDGGDIVRPRWTTSGWTIFNNKGNPVKQYEPFFSADHAFEFGVTVGVSPTLFYDPVGRVVATLHPNHTWEKVIFDPWRQETWDVNDTVLAADPASDPDVGGYFERLYDTEYLPAWHQARIDGGMGNPEQDAAQKAAAYADTPAIVHFDSLGRPFLSIANNGSDGQYQTRTEQDIEGNPLRIIDDRGNVVMAYQVESNGNLPVRGYDEAGRPFYENSMDSSERWVLADVGGKPISSWDSRGHILRSTYDELQRPTHLFVLREGEPELLAEMTVYGEGHPDAESLNLRGQVYQAYDGAGVVTGRRFDFKDNPLESSRQLARECRTTVDWSALADLKEIGEIEAAGASLLGADVFTIQTDYDALNRPVAITTPDNSVTLPTYNEANLLEQMAVRLRGADQATPFVANIDYNARGQRERITYATADGTNFTTTYGYDPETFRLTLLDTLRHRDNRALQNLNYAHDPVGNITSIRDNGQQIVFFSNTQVEPHNDYTYDALYRLIQAEGREHAAQNNIQRDATDFVPVIGIPFANSPEALQRYVEEYAYDSVGNILSMRHIGGAIERWTRRYQYAEDSNRLLATSLPGDGANEFSAPYSYDTHGNMTTMPHLPLTQWDFKDHLQATSRQVVNGGTPEMTYYVYDSGGQRVRKVTERQAAGGQTPTRRNERLYIGGFEVYREYNGGGSTVTLERETLHVMDDQQRIAQIDTRTHGNDDAPAQTRRYQLSNHLGSAMLEVDEQANVISHEEDHPYGTSAYRAGRSAAEVSLKRYRYTGKERDVETSLYYHGARYYACWLGRWTAVDPERLVDGLNIYLYVGANPIRFLDETGNGPKEQKLGAGSEAALKKHQRLANKRRAQKKMRRNGKPLKQIKSAPNEPIGKRGEGQIIPDDIKGDTTVIEQKARHTASKRNTKQIDIRRDIRGALEQNTEQLRKAEASGRVRPGAEGKTVIVIHDSDGGVSSTEAKGPRKQVARDVQRQYVEEAAGDPVEHDLRKRTKPVVTTRDRISRATKALEKSIENSDSFYRRAGKAFGHAGKVLGPFGIAIGVESVLDNLVEGDLQEASLDAIGLVPGFGDALDLGRAAYEIGSAYKELKEINDALDEYDREHRTNKRGSPGFLRPKSEPNPPPPVQEEIISPDDDMFIGPRLPEYLDPINARVS